MKLLLLGIAIILFGMTLIYISSGSAGIIGFTVSCLGLIISIVGAIKKDAV
jgi:hypothetical protein